MAPHSSTLAWKIPWMEKSGGLQSMGSLRVGHDWATSLSLFTFMCWRRKWQPTPVFSPGESQEQRSLVGCRLWGRTESDTTERLSSSSSSSSILTWVWASSASSWWTGKSGTLQSMGSKRVRHNWVTELNWTYVFCFSEQSQRCQTRIQELIKLTWSFQFIICYYFFLFGFSILATEGITHLILVTA